MSCVSFMPYVTQTNASSQHPGFLHTVLDYDDGTALTAVTQCEQYDTYKVFSLTTSSFRTLTPAVSAAVYNGVATTGYAVAPRGKRGPWLDSSSAGIFYYGIKYVTDQTQIATATSVCSVRVELWLEFRAPN